MARIGILLIVVALVAGVIGCGGSYPPPSRNLEIRTWYDLNATRNNLAGNHTLMNNLDSSSPGYAELASPTANSGKGWQPIGDLIDRFSGSLDGQGYEIKDLFINRPSELSVGLFGCANGTIKNVGVVNANVTGERPVGIIMGINDGTVNNSYSTGSVRGDWLVGGLLGHNREEGTVSDSHATSNVTGNSSVGGLVGWNVGTISNSYSMGNVTGNSSAGGLVGHNSAAVNSSYATGSVVGSYYIGGLVGENYIFGTVSNSYATSNVTGDYDVGGLVGANDATVSNSYSMGSVTGNQYVGGLLGDISGFGTVSNSFWDTETSGQATSAGGTGKNTTEMQDIITFSGATWDMIAVALNETNPAYIWNIVNNVTYPFLSWQPAS
jgi:hypothetical protein